jgi:hypothetical protein
MAAKASAGVEMAGVEELTVNSCTAGIGALPHRSDQQL